MIAKSQKRTRYQATHYPTETVEVKCASRKPLTPVAENDLNGGFCPDCGRYLHRAGRDHLPDRTGSLGWIEHYADGTTRVVGPGDR